jgi:hypothetical protein
MLSAVSNSKKAFFCSGTSPRFTDWENFADKTSAQRNLWDFGNNPADHSQGFHITGYLFAFSGTKCLLIASNQNTTLQPEHPKKFVNANLFYPDIPIPADRVLVADTTICSPAGVPYAQRYTFPNITYKDVTGGGFYLLHISPHLKGIFPMGGNVGFKDGHVMWRKFDDMDQRATGGTSFWW